MACSKFYALVLYDQLLIELCRSPCLESTTVNRVLVAECGHNQSCGDRDARDLEYIRVAPFMLPVVARTREPSARCGPNDAYVTLALKNTWHDFLRLSPDRFPLKEFLASKIHLSDAVITMSSHWNALRELITVE